MFPPDGWRHFVDERDEILAFIEDNNVTGAVVFSGDIHLAATTAVALPGTSGGEVLEFSASPIMAPPLRPGVHLRVVCVCVCVCARVRGSLGSASDG